MKISRRELIGIALAAAARAASPRPRRVVLVHGLLGFPAVSRLNYFNGVRQWFDAGCEFIEPQLNPVGSIEDRAGTLYNAIKSCVPPADLNRGRALHIVAHSMGGLDARCLISKFRCEQWFVSITTISTPNQGSAIADIVTHPQNLNVADLAPLSTLLTPEHWRAFFASLQRPSFDFTKLLLPTPEIREQLGGYLAAAFGSPPEAFKNLTTSYIRDFNSRYPGFGSVPVQAYAGVSNPNATMTPLLYVPWAILRTKYGDNDGLVPVASSKWKGAATTVAADHIEEVNLASVVDGSAGSQTHFAVQRLYQPVNQWQASKMTDSDAAPLSKLLNGCPA